MSENDNRRGVPPKVTILIIVFMLPVLAFPTLLSLTPAGSAARTFVWFYPVYVIAAGICARICYPERRDVMWILLVLMALSHAAMWALVIAGHGY